MIRVDGMEKEGEKRMIDEGQKRRKVGMIERGEGDMEKKMIQKINYI